MFGLSSYRTQWALFWLLGTINNLSYVVVGSAAKSLADSFHKSKLIGVIQWANVAIGLFLRSLNAFKLDGTSYSLRVAANTAMMAAGLVALACSVYVDFSFAVFAIVLVGGASSFGESVLLGYLKAFNPELTGAWSSGTGMAGVGGSLAYIALASGAGLSNQTVFLILIPFCAVYWASFAAAARTHKDYNKLKVVAGDDSALGPESLEESYSSLDENDGLISKANGSAAARDQAALSVQSAEGGGGGVAGPAEGAVARTMRVGRLVLSPSVQLGAVYFFEYAVSVGFAAIANVKPEHGGSWFRDNAYPVLAFCYQLGVFVSRSSISVVKIDKIEWLTALQGLNFAGWLVHSLHPFIPLWLQFTWMFYVGLLGGAAYVNIFYKLVRDPNIGDQDKELGINIAAIFINIGIVLSAIFEIVADDTFLADRVDATN